MFDAKRIGRYYVRTSTIVMLALLALVLLSLMAVIIAELTGYSLSGNVNTILILTLIGTLPGLGALPVAFRIVRHFMRDLYDIQDADEIDDFLNQNLVGSPKYGPYLFIKGGKIVAGSERVRKIGGPGNLVIYADSAVVLARGGKLTRVVVGPDFLNPKPQNNDEDMRKAEAPLAHFEKVVDVIDLRPHRWVFAVEGLTEDGIPVTMKAMVRFQVAPTQAQREELEQITDADKRSARRKEMMQEAVFKAFKAKWIRTADNTEAWRLMDWPKRMIIGSLEGGLRGILSHYQLDDLLEISTRLAIQMQLETKLNTSADGLGLELLSAGLGEIMVGWGEAKAKILEQWFEAWRAERVREIAETRAKGRATRIKIEERARTTVRRRTLEHTATMLQELADKHGHKAAERMVLMAFIEMIRDIEQQFYNPDQIYKTYQELSAKLGACTSVPDKDENELEGGGKAEDVSANEDEDDDASDATVPVTPGGAM